jgi:hypothetical protein
MNSKKIKEIDLDFEINPDRIKEEPEMDIFEQWRKERESKPWIVRKLEFIPMWWRNDGKYLHRTFWTGLKNLWHWFPVIWKDRNWDHQFIFDILSHKLKAQSKYIGDRGNHISAERDAEVMMTCVRLIKKVQDEFYSMEYMEYEKTKHWFEDVPDSPGYSSWESRQLEENFDDYFKKYPLIHKRVLNGEGWLKIEDFTDKHRIASNIAHINHKRAKKLLFKIMEENIEGWWD